MKPHKNTHPLLKRARAFNALAMRSDMPFDHYKRLAANCLAEYHRIQARNKLLATRNRKGN